MEDHKLEHPLTRNIQTTHVYASWKMNTPVGTLEGDGMYEVAYPIDMEGLHHIKQSAAVQATAGIKTQAAKAGHIIPALPPQAVLLMCVCPMAAPKDIISQ